MRADLLTSRALNRATLARQLLLARAELPVHEAVHLLVGLQAQEPLDPYTALWSRVKRFRAEALAALLRDRAAVRLPRHACHDPSRRRRRRARAQAADAARARRRARATPRVRPRAPRRRPRPGAGVRALLAEPHTSSGLRGALAERFPGTTPPRSHTRAAAGSRSCRCHRAASGERRRRSRWRRPRRGSGDRSPGAPRSTISSFDTSASSGLRPSRTSLPGRASRVSAPSSSDCDRGCGRSATSVVASSSTFPTRRGPTRTCPRHRASSSVRQRPALARRPRTVPHRRASGAARSARWARPRHAPPRRCRLRGSGVSTVTETPTALCFRFAWRLDFRSVRRRRSRRPPPPAVRRRRRRSSRRRGDGYRIGCVAPGAVNRTPRTPACPTVGRRDTCVSPG